MDSNGPVGGVTSPTTRDGELEEGPTHYEGMAVDRGRYVEQPGFARRISASGQDPAAIRRLIQRAVPA